MHSTTQPVNETRTERRNLRPGRMLAGPGVAAALTFVFFMTLTLVSWFVVKDLEERNARMRFDKVVAEATARIEHRLAGYEQVLRGALGLMLASYAVSREEWRTYVHALRIDDNYPGIHGIGFARHIHPEDLAGHVAEIRAEGFPRYEVWPAGPRDEYTSIIYLEPFSERNLRAFGYDMYSNPVRREAMVRARDTGKPALTGKIRLVQETDEDVQAGFLMYIPRYGIPEPRTIEERRYSLVGYVYAPFRMDDFIHAILGGELAVLDLKIFDGESVTEDSMLFDSSGNPSGKTSPPGFRQTSPITVYGHTWTIEAASRPAFEQSAKSYEAFLILLGGTMVSILTAVVALILWVNRQKAVALGHMNEKLLAAMEEQQATTRELAASKLRTERILESITDPFYTLDRTWRFTYVNREAEKLLRRHGRDLLGKVIWEETGEAKKFLHHKLHQAQAEGKTMTFDYFQRPDNKWFEVHVYPAEEGLAVSFRDISVRKQAEQERQESIARIRQQASLLDNATDAIIVRGIDHRIQFWNRGAERLYGWTPEEMIGTPIVALYDNVAAFEKAAEQVLTKGEWRGEIEQRRKDGSVLIAEGHWTLVKNDEGLPESIFAINTDITQRKMAENEIQYLAFYDSLTGLPNRQLLLDRLRQALATSARNQRMGALLFIDLDNFKLLNDTLGHDLGDMLLKQIAPRLLSCVRESDTVARLGGDEFVIVLVADFSEIHDEAVAQIRTICERILAAFSQPFDLGIHKHHTTPSIGVALFYDQTQTTDELLKRADLAMYHAKAAGRNAMRFFDLNMQETMNARIVLESDLYKSWERNEFVLHYQPQVGKHGVIGAEALLRWQHPRRGLLSPAEFIPQSEETNLILPLGSWVLETACKQLATWSTRPETARLNLAVNVSPRQFGQVDFVDMIIGIIESTGADPQKLKIELTESILLNNMDETVSKMATLKARGVGFALDDFGIGYSSLYYLKRLPLDWVKIDQSFIRDILSDSNDATIVRAILLLARSMGIAVIAEGVETEAQRDFLADHGCTCYQGYLYSTPLPAHEFEKFLLDTAWPTAGMVPGPAPDQPKQSEQRPGTGGGTGSSPQRRARRSGPK